jgi:hypothetical protein
MTTPSPGNPILISDLITDLGITTPTPALLTDFNEYSLFDGYADCYDYGYNNSGVGNYTISMSAFYDLEASTPYSVQVQNTVPANLIDCNFTINRGTIQGNAGPNVASPSFNDGGTMNNIAPGVTQGGSGAPHWAQIDITVTINATGVPPPIPTVNIEYSYDGSTYTSFPGAPFQVNPGASYTSGLINNCGLGQTIYVRVS